jgi:hypothetical protein
VGSYRTGKNTTDGYRSIDVRNLARLGHLRPGSSFSFHWSQLGVPVASVQAHAGANSVVLSDRQRPYGSDQWEQKDYPVRLVRTPSHYGGERTWFLCPARGCGRRVAILYGGDIFACRHCHCLAYRSQREQGYQRALSHTQAIRVRLGGSGSIADPFPSKPKGMHWSTYQRLRLEAEAAAGRSWPPWLMRRIGAGL